jgi:cell wall-associated NlpC family hydrolase
MSLDARVSPVRDGVASRRLEGVAPAEVYLDPRPRTCIAPAAAIRRTPDASSEQMDQLLFGEIFEVIEEEEGGFVWGQARRDGYVGFVEAASLAEPGPAPTHWISALRTYAFAQASIKSKASGPYSQGSLVAVEAVEGKLARIWGAGWITAEHLTPIGVVESDAAAVAQRYVGAPYLWGGRESLGLDCSGLVLQALSACGMACPRDADQQEAMGRQIDKAEFGRNDLVFWKGHVAMGIGEGRIVHANGHHMATVVEPLETAIERIGAAGYPPTAFRRIF